MAERLRAFPGARALAKRGEVCYNGRNNSTLFDKIRHKRKRFPGEAGGNLHSIIQTQRLCAAGRGKEAVYRMERQELDQGAARTAAELRMQLAQITAASQLLERTARDEKSRSYLAAMNQGICRMLRIVGRLEITGRLGGKDPRLERSPADLGRLTQELGERLAGLLECAEVKLEVSAPEGLWAWVDVELIRQVLMELVANAAAAGRRVRLSVERLGESAVFTVEDDGPGVEPERLQYLFDSGGQAAPDWRRGGVGIAVARKAAQLHGGTVIADCAPGQGLRAVVSIPLGEPGEGLLREPGADWDRGGFDDELVALSKLLPAWVFGPEPGGDERLK